MADEIVHMVDESGYVCGVRDGNWSDHAEETNCPDCFRVAVERHARD